MEGINWWGVFFFIMPIVVSLLVGSITLIIVIIKEVKRKFKIRRVAKCQRYHF